MSIEVSVVIPLYNKERYIEETLRSVLGQKTAPREIIVVDDGSTDRSLEILGSLAIPQLRVLSTSSPRSGPSAARNLGVRSASFEFVAFLDADDLWAPDYLSEAEAALAEFSEADGFFCEKQFLLDGHVQGAECEPGGRRVIDCDEFFRMWIKREECPLWTSASIFRRDVLVESGGFLLPYRRGEDKELWFRILLSAKMAYSPKSLALYRRGIEGQLTTAVPRDVPALTHTARRYAHAIESGRRKEQIKAISNITLWHYAKINRGQVPLSSGYLTHFYPSVNFVKYLGVVGVFLLGRLRSSHLRRKSQK